MRCAQLVNRVYTLGTPHCGTAAADAWYWASTAVSVQPGGNATLVVPVKDLRVCSERSQCPPWPAMDMTTW